MKKLFLPALLCAALLSTATSCSDNKAGKPDSTDTAGNNADDNYMGGATNSETNAMTDGDTTGASDQGTQPESRTAPANMDGYSAGTDNTATMPHSTDQEFMKSAAHSDQNEIQLSRLALEKGVSGMAKDHANMMIKDHTKSTTDLKAIAQKKNVTLPTDMDPEHKALAADMRKLSGTAFEQRYLQQMVMDHQKTLNTLKAHATMTQDADLKGFIGKVTPVVQSHLDMSKKHANMKM